MESEQEPQLGWYDHFLKGVEAHQKGDLEATETHLRAGLSLDTRGVLELRLLMADLLEGRDDLAGATDELQAAALAYPNNEWPPLKLAMVFAKLGNFDAALEHLDRVRWLDVDGTFLHYHVVRARLSLEIGQPESAVEALISLSRMDPNHASLPGWLLAAYRQLKRASAVRPIFEHILSQGTGPSISAARKQFAQMLMEADDTEAAVEQLEGLREWNGGDADVLMRLVHAYHAMRNEALEQARIGEAIAAQPENKALLRHMFAFHCRLGNQGQLDTVLDWVGDAFGGPLQRELAITTYLQTMRFARALEELRKTAQEPDTGSGRVERMVHALFGVHRYALGLRYLRLAIRRWPDSDSLKSLYLLWLLKLGHMEQARACLAAWEGRVGAVLMTGFRLQVAGFENDLERAIALYKAVQEVGRPSMEQRELLAKLIFTQAEFAAIDDIVGQIGDLRTTPDAPLHRNGLAGMMTLEIDIERQNLEHSGMPASFAEWVQASPHSTLAAIRLVDEWGAAQDGKTRKKGAAKIPRQIFQYWDKPEVPEDVQAISDSWKRVRGFDYQIFSRSSALAFLGEEFGREWQQALRLAQSAAEEADLLRLCLLARRGGIYVDADDYLRGSLTQLLPKGRELVLYRECMGGAIGNNFLAAAPDHPVIERAAQMACEALLGRENEMAWSKTGPGLLTRALAQHLAQEDETGADIAVLSYEAAAGQIAMHTSLRYKTSMAHWEKQHGRQQGSDIWSQMVAATQAVAQG